MNLTRRGFLKIAAAAPLVVVAPRASALWLPSQEIALPEEKEIQLVKEAILDRSLIGVYITWQIPSELFLMELESDSRKYFLPGTPMMILFGGYKPGRYSFRGSQKEIEGYRLKALNFWINGQEAG